jgi:DNA polymerase III subunit epsilon
MEFVAIDVETANPDFASICQVGLAHFRDGSLVEEWVSLVNPEQEFFEFNTELHGIDEDAVKDAPTLPQIAPAILERFDGRIVVSHTHFDRTAIRQAFDVYGLEVPCCTWLDSARVARRTWAEVSYSGYGLANVAKLIGYEFAHHDALEDAKAAGRILLAAMELSGLGVDEWLERVAKPIDPNASGAPLTRAGNQQGPLYGEVVVFTGALQVTRREAADMADAIGCEVAAGVTKHTTMLVVGDQDVAKLAGHEKSSKHRKAETLMAKGQAIRILRESDFARLVEMSD